MHVSRSRVVASLVVALAVAVSGLSHEPSPVRAAGSITALASTASPAIGSDSGQQSGSTSPAATSASTPVRPRSSFHGGVEAGGVDDLHRCARPGGPGRWHLRERPAVRGCDPSGPRCRREGPRLQRSTGRFVISEIERDVDGNITTLAAVVRAALRRRRPERSSASSATRRAPATSSWPSRPTTIDLGSAGVGSATPTQTVHLTSGGTDGVTISELSITGANAGDFAIASANCRVGVLAPA